jgi:hypothetical protein
MNVLDIAEQKDGYLEACNNSTPNAEARRNYNYDLSKISTKAEDFLIQAVQDIPLLKGCEIVILDSTADAGFPHTRPQNYICLPESMCKESSATDTFKTTLIHEGIHINQRKNRAFWEFSLNSAGWTPVEKGQIPDKFLDSIRLNPDTIGIPFYAFNRFHIPLPLFPPSTIRPTLQNAEVKWYDTRTKSLFHEPPKEFINKYGNNIRQSEHPYEIYAELFSDAGITTSDGVLKALSNI